MNVIPYVTGDEKRGLEIFLDGKTESFFVETVFGLKRKIGLQILNAEVRTVMDPGCNEIQISPKLPCKHEHASFFKNLALQWCPVCGACKDGDETDWHCPNPNWSPGV